MSDFLITVTLGKYFIKAFSVMVVNVSPSTAACARAYFTKPEFRKRVTRCLLLVVILHIVQLIVVLVKSVIVMLPAMADLKLKLTLDVKLENHQRKRTVFWIISLNLSKFHFRTSTRSKGILNVKYYPQPNSNSRVPRNFLQHFLRIVCITSPYLLNCRTILFLFYALHHKVLRPPSFLLFL